MFCRVFRYILIPESLLLWLELCVSTRTILYPPSVLALFRYKGTTPLFTCSMNLDNFFKSVDEEIYLTAL